MKKSTLAVPYSLEDLFEERKTKTVQYQARFILFSVFNNVFERKIPLETLSFFSKCVATGANLYVSLQIASLLWRSDMNIKDWSNYGIFWRVLSVSRIDLCCAYLNLIQEALLAVNCLLLLVFLSLILCHALVLSNRTILSPFKEISGRGIKLVSTIFFIPIVDILLIDYKYYFSKSTSITEYSVQNQSSGNPLSLARSSLSLLFVMTVNLIFEYFGSEIRHTAKDKVIYAKSSMDVDLQVKFLHATLVVANIFMYEQHPQLFQILLLLCSCYNAFQYLYFLPYYSMYINKLKVLSCSMESIVALAFLIGYILDDSQTILVIVIFITPCWCFIINSLVEYRQSFIKNIDAEQCSQFMLELLLREKLAETSNQDREILTKIDESFVVNNFENCQLMGVWQVYYCMNVLGDYRMAFIKLCNCLNLTYSLSADFQIFKCSYMLNSIDFIKYEDLSYIRYTLALENLKKEDMKVCISLLNFWGELIDQGSMQDLNTLVEEAAHRITNVQAQYQYLIENYPSGDNCRTFFRTFLHDIVLDFALQDKLASKMNSNRECINSGTINYFDDSNGVIIVSGAKANIGEVIYSNYKFSEMIDQQLNTIIGSNITSLIPDLYSHNHDKNLIRFVRFCTESLVNVSDTLFLQTGKGYIVEALIELRCSAINSSAFFLAIFKQVESKRHIILYNNGIIFSYSRDLPEFLGLQNVKMMKMQDIFDFSTHSMDIDVNYMKIFRGKPIWVTKACRNVGKTLMSVLLIHESEDEVNHYDQNFKRVKETRENCNHTPEIESKIKDETKKENRVAFDIDSSIEIIKKSEEINDGMVEFHENKLLESKSSNLYQASTTVVNLSDKYSNKILLEALRGVKIYKWILLIFVRYS